MALTWTWEHIGKVIPAITPPLTIKIDPYDP